MDFDYNRAAFRSVCQASGVQPLALAYCYCVLLELGLKQHLSLISSTVNVGHDLPQLVHRFGNQNRRHLTVCNSFQRQLADALTKLLSQHKNGTAGAVPSRSYPYMRYLRHANDWIAPCSPEQDITDLVLVLQKLIYFFRGKAGIAI